MKTSNWCKVKYLDASALVKLYLDENDSQNIRDFFYSNQANFRTTWLCLAEAISILKSKWKGTQSKNLAVRIDNDTYFKATCALIINWRKRIDSEDLELVDPSIPLKVGQIARTYALDYSDALQLFTIKNGRYTNLHYESAPGVYEPALVFITADENLASAAQSEGIRVWNCAVGPAPEWAY